MSPRRLWYGVVKGDDGSPVAIHAVEATTQEEARQVWRWTRYADEAVTLIPAEEWEAPTASLVPFPSSRTAEILAELEEEGRRLHGTMLRDALSRAERAEEGRAAAEGYAQRLLVKLDEVTDRARDWQAWAAILSTSAFLLGLVVGLWGRL